MHNPVLTHLLTRKSAPITTFGGAEPPQADIDLMLTAAARVPDHGRLTPWRFIIYRGECRNVIGDRLAELALKRDPSMPPGAVEKERTRFNRAPLVIGVIYVPVAHERIPEWEQQLSAGAAAMNLVHAATALGYCAHWLTNWFAFDAAGRALLGLKPDERVAGFIHVGHSSFDVPERPRPALADIVSEYSGPVE